MEEEIKTAAGCGLGLLGCCAAIIGLSIVLAVAVKLFKVIVS